MNYSILRGMIASAYKKIDNPTWTVKEYFKFFVTFLDKYKHEMGRDHYNIPMTKLLDIMNELPAINDEFGNPFDIEEEYYEDIIDKYFATNMDCDYSIYHFMSGNIRLYRFYEVLY